MSVSTGSCPPPVTAAGSSGASHASATKRHPPGYRAPELPYLIDVARAADRLGYESVLTPDRNLV